jgi:hypothetical protein
VELAERAHPGIEEHADEVADAACRLADLAVPGGWNRLAVEDALTAIDVLAGTMGEISPQVAEVLVAVTAATSTARRRLGLPVDPEPAPDGTPMPGPRAARRTRSGRRGLGPGYQGIR